MTGSLQIKNNHYYAVLYLRDINGRKQQKWISSKIPAYDSKGRQTNKREAERFIKNIIDKYQENDSIAAAEIAFTDYMLEWLAAMETSLELNTFYNYKNAINHNIVPYFKKRNVKLQDLTPAELQYFYEAMTKRGLSASTVRKLHANIHKALKKAVRLRIINSNPADNVDLPKIKDKYKAKYYNQEQIVKMLDAVKGHFAESAIYLAALFGLRRSEVLGLKWDYIDFNTHTLTIRDTVVTAGSKTIDKSRTKNKSSYRTLSLSTQAEDYLKRVKAKQLEEQLYFGNTYYNSDYVCRREDGTPLKPDYFSQVFQALLKKNNLPSIRLHDLRHSCASLLLANGYELKEIQEWLGHSDIGTTSDIYAHLQAKSKVNMAASIGKALLSG